MEFVSCFGLFQNRTKGREALTLDLVFHNFTYSLKILQITKSRMLSTVGNQRL